MFLFLFLVLKYYIIEGKSHKKLKVENKKVEEEEEEEEDYGEDEDDEEEEDFEENEEDEEGEEDIEGEKPEDDSLSSEWPDEIELYVVRGIYYYFLYY